MGVGLERRWVARRTWLGEFFGVATERRGARASLSIGLHQGESQGWEKKRS